MPEAADTRRRAYTVTLIVIVCFFLGKDLLVLRSIDQGRDRDYYRWFRIAQAAADGEPLANPRGAGAVGLEDDEGHVTYYKLPPAFAVYVAPLGELPYKVYVLLYYRLSFAAGVAAFLLAMRLLHGRWLPENPAALILPLAVFVVFAHDDLHCGSNNLIVLAFIVGGLYLASRGCSAAGGLSLGMAVSLKAFPLAVVIGAALMRRWKLAAWSLAAAAVWTLLVPGLVRGFGPTWRDNVNWAQRVVVPYAQGREHVQWSEKGASVSNQALWGTVTRLVRDVNAAGQFGAPDDAGLKVNVLRLSARGAAAVFAGLVVLAAAAMAWAAWRGAAPPSRLRDGVDLGLACIFVLLLSPVAWTYFFTILLLPLAVAGLLIARRPRRGPARLALAAYIATWPLMILSLWDGPRAVGVLTWVAILWFVVLLIVRRHLAAEPAEDNTPPVGTTTRSS